MDYSRGVTTCDAMRETSTTAYPTFAAPTPINLSRGYSANTLTPGAIPSPLNFPSITPPSSPYSLYGLYSPAGRPSTMYDPAYLRKLKSNPMFRDLQSLLLQECLQMQVPASLITTSWNLMELHNNTSNNNNHHGDQAPPPGNAHPRQKSNRNSGQQVYLQHMKLQDKLLKVRIDPAISADGLLVENDYSKEVGRVEMERYRALHSCSESSVKETINGYYDKERLSLANKTEQRLDSLIVKAEQMRATAQKSSNITVPTSSNSCTTTEQRNKLSLAAQSGVTQGASLLLQPADEEKTTAVRKLKFSMKEGVVQEGVEKEEEEEEEEDYLNGSVNSEDFEIDEIDVETVDKDDNAGHHTSDYMRAVPQNKQSDNSDLLQQCLSESGITEATGTKHELSFDLDRLISESSPLNESHQSHSQVSHVSMSHNNTTDSIYPDSSTIDSPMSLDSAESVSHNTSDSSSITKETTHTELTPDMKQPVDYDYLGHSDSSTPLNLMQKFQTNNNNINMTLYQMTKMCNGPSINFTPEMRRDTTHSGWTPDAFKLSPLTGHTPVPSVYDNQHVKNNVPSYPWSHLTNNRPQHYNRTISMTTTEPSRKRKTPCDEEVSNDVKNNNIYNSSSNSSRNSSSSNNNNQTTDNNSVSSANNELSEVPKNAVFRTRGTLTAQATNILSQWYHAHISYPYPNDEEVEQLTAATGITDRQVKKWMANKRVRCFNTLSITGNQHPIKHKYKGQGRKKKSAGSESTVNSDSVEKENCDSTTEDKRANYSVLTEEAKHQLNQWYEAHIHNPYPTEEEKQQLADECNISLGQIKSWFANKRNRTNNTRRQVPNYFINKFPEYCPLVQMVGQRREENRQLKRRKLNEYMYIQPSFYF